MGDQVQCPNCGGYRTETIRAEPIYGKLVPFTDKEKRARWFGWFLFGGAGIPLLLLMSCGLAGLNLVGGGGLQGSITLFSLVCFPLFLALIWSGILYFLLFKLSKGTRPVEATIYHYACWLCGYKWNWHLGTPMPEVRVRPDLIAKGEQHLREQAASDDAAYHAFVEPNLPKFGK